MDQKTVLIIAGLETEQDYYRPLIEATLKRAREKRQLIDICVLDLHRWSGGQNKINLRIDREEALARNLSNLPILHDPSYIEVDRFTDGGVKQGMLPLSKVSVAWYLRQNRPKQEDPTPIELLPALLTEYRDKKVSAEDTLAKILAASEAWNQQDQERRVRWMTEDESLSALLALAGELSRLGCRWVNHHKPAGEITQEKTRQLTAARDLGILIPEFTVSNDRREILEFCGRMGGHVALKSLTPYPRYLQTGEVLLTKKLSYDQLHRAGAELNAAPCYFQQWIEKRHEHRTLVLIGKEPCVLSCKRYVEGEIDSRGANFKKLPPERQPKPSELPQELQKGLIELQKGFGLNYGIMDIVETSDGKLYFLEDNPAGQWQDWFVPAGVAFPEAVADMLLSI